MAILEKKQQVLEPILDYLLAEGLQSTGIRTLARQAGISDRMLIYYFGSKDKLLEEALELLSQRTADGLNLLIGEGRHGAGAILASLDAAGDIQQFEDAMRLFLEVVAKGARGIEPYRSAAQATVSYWREWLDARLETGKDTPSTDELLEIIEGRILLRLVDKA